MTYLTSMRRKSKLRCVPQHPTKPRVGWPPRCGVEEVDFFNDAFPTLYIQPQHIAWTNPHLLEAGIGYPST